MFDFCILLLSRNRPILLEQLLDSIISTSKSNFEVIVGCDLCGNPYSHLHSKYKNNNITFYYKQRDKNLHVFLNKLAEVSKAKYYFILNDDCILTNNEWDIKALELLNDYCYGRTHDDSIDKVGQYASFPIISRQSYLDLGFVMDDTFGNHGGDVMTYRIYKEAGLVVDLPCVRVSHLYHNSAESLVKRVEDKTATDMIQRTYNEDFSIQKLFTCDISQKVAKLNARCI